MIVYGAIGPLFFCCFFLFFLNLRSQVSVYMTNGPLVLKMWVFRQILDLIQESSKYSLSEQF